MGYNMTIKKRHDNEVLTYGLVLAKVMNMRF